MNLWPVDFIFFFFKHKKCLRGITLIKRYKFKYISLMILFFGWAIFLLVSGKASAQESRIEREPDYKEIGSSIESAIQVENESLVGLKQELSRIQATKSIIETELRTYNFLLSVHGNLLLLPDVQTKDLEKALGDNQAASTNVTARIKEYSQQQDTLLSAIQQTNERIEISKDQLQDISTAKAPSTGIKPLQQGLRSLLSILK